LNCLSSFCLISYAWAKVVVFIRVLHRFPSLLTK
jgi:hypothetical protein